MKQNNFFNLPQIEATVTNVENYYLRPNMNRLNFMNKAAFLYVLRLSVNNHKGILEEYNYCERCFFSPSWKVGDKVRFFKSSHKTEKNLARMTSGYPLLIPIDNKTSTYPTDKKGFMLDNSVEAHTVYKHKYEFILELFIGTFSFIIILAMLLALPAALIYFLIK